MSEEPFDVRIDVRGPSGREIRCAVLRTDEPWRRGIDGIAVSVGTTLGGLGSALQRAFPGDVWDQLRFDDVTPNQALVLPLGDLTAIFVTPHAPDVHGLPTLEAVSMAARSAVRSARTASVSVLGLSLIGVGRLGFPAEAVADVVVTNALDQADLEVLESLVFFAQDTEGTTALLAALRNVQRSWSRLHDEPSGQPAGTASHEPDGAPSDELAGGVSSDLVDPNVGIPGERDQLGVIPYVSMLATVIADRATMPPLSVGVFGAWGSGKSTFMGLLRQRLTELSRTGGPYCGEIVQIGFNAWHYADSNLWASLGDEIFRQLAGPGPTSDMRRKQLHDELTDRLQQRRELNEVTTRASAAVAELQAKVDEAEAARDTRTADLFAAMRESEAFRERLADIWRSLGVNDRAEQSAVLAEQLGGALTEAEALRRVPRSRRGRLAFIAAALVLVVGAVATAVSVVAAPAITGWLASIGGGIVLTALAVGVTAVTRARDGLTALRTLTEDLRAGMDRAARTRLEPVLAERVEALREAEAVQQIAQAQLDEVVARVGELGGRLAELEPGQRLYAFLAERAEGDAYTGNLGLISTIRKDFRELVALLADWREHPAKVSPHRPIDRIVLYIDDLDRCSPRQVVDVLQAVHLLLALELFVVVVGVDPRWLLRSLCEHYDSVLDADPTPMAGGWRVTPEDYLEKIINIPVVLPGMTSGSLRGLLASIVDGTRPGSAQPEGAGTTDTAAGLTDTAARMTDTAGGVAAFTIEAGSEVDEQGITPGRRQAPEPRPLTEPELDLFAALEPLVGTPREAKRLFNLYRMLRATRDLSPASRFLGDDDEPGEYQAVVVLLGLLTAHARLLRQVVDATPGGLMHRASTTPWREFVDELKPRAEDGGWSNPVIGAIGDDEVTEWRRLHAGLERVSSHVTLEDVAAFQTWVPRIRRFSYVLSEGA